MVSEEATGRGDPAGVVSLVVTWRSQGRIASCLDALAAAGAGRVLVVDNGSTDGTRELLAGRSDVRVVRSERNLGFAGGVALGWEHLGDPDFVLLVNDDAEVSPDFITRMRAAASGSGAERVAAWTARILLPPDPDGCQRVNSTGSVVLTDGRGADRDWLQPADGPEPSPDVFGFCGAAALLRVSAVQEVGGFDERLFLYYEDTDVSWRLRLAGWQIRYVHDAVAVHAHAQSSGAASEVFLMHNFRNRLLCLVKNAPAGLAVREPFRLLAQALIAPFCGPALRSTGRVRWRALGSFLHLLPGALRERRRIGRTAVVPRRVVAAWRTTEAAARVNASETGVRP